MFAPEGRRVGVGVKVQLGVEDLSVGELRVGVCKVGLSCLTFGQHAAHTTGSPPLLSSVPNGLSSSGSLRNSETLRSPHLQQFLLVSDFNAWWNPWWKYKLLVFNSCGSKGCICVFELAWVWASVYSRRRGPPYPPPSQLVHPI